ncbi:MULTISPECIES: hypothetical protein [Gordonia]|uniref:Uncharacterized protein n=1 Tax=Gordonia amicalis TaxID=89053 RepID=A0AAE4R3J3_9ACTN|nr:MULTISPECIES: hypothetical protein [Gordonia]ATD72514.1 hypothetical protein CNO18_21870 [Gordonia sp. 1D]MCZ0915096.1 hypothetical protein [Gordonia amicalis]MDJ0455295.1 hypothetical protein [Gordonia amicalis]MDV6309015.1 hypothetical protein [Gordonia amicalis]MDV6312668.1 hypothetical protein [Gordonia amicalis]
MSTRILEATRELTGFDAAHVGSGSGVLVVGTEGAGVRTLVDAIRELAPGLEIHARDVQAREPGPDSGTRPGVALVVVDPSSSVDDEERHLVEQVRAQIGTVALVCTKIDAFWEWPRIVRAHRTTLDPFGTMPVFGVSAAAALGGDVVDSGVDALVDWIREAHAAPDALRLERARVAAGVGAVEHLLADADAGTGTDSSGTLDDLMSARRRLLSSRDRGRIDRLAAVRAGLARARAQCSAELQSRVRELAAAADHAPEVDDAEHRSWLDTRWADLAEDIRRDADERIDEVAATALVGLDPEPSPREPWSDTPLPADGPGNRRRRGGAEDALLVVIGASTGLGVGRLVVAPMASVQTLQWISMPLTLLLGIGVAVWVIRVRRGALDRADRLTRVSERLAVARSALDHQLGLRFSAAETRTAGQIARAHERRARRTTEQVAEIDDDIRRLRSGAGQQETRIRRDRAEGIRRELVARSEWLWGSEGLRADESDGPRPTGSTEKPDPGTNDPAGPDDRSNGDDRTR